MSRSLKLTLGVAAITALLAGSYVFYAKQVANPRVEIELRSDPNGMRAQRVLLLTFQDSTTIPVNYRREGQQVFVGADGGWWRRFRDAGAPVTLYLRGNTRTGHAIAVLNDPAYTRAVFARLRPAAPGWLPDWLNGVLVVITLDAQGDA